MSEAHPYAFEKLWNYADPAGSEAAFRQHLAAHDPRGPERAELLTQIARACCLQRHHGQARAALDEARALLAPGASRPRVRWLLELGRLCNDQGTERSGVPHFEEAWRLARECREPFHAVDAAHMLGYVHEGEESIRWHEAGLAMVRATDDERTRRWHYRLLSNLGRKLVDRGRFGEALRTFEEALSVAEARSLSADVIRDARRDIASVHRSAGDPERALAILRGLEEEVAATDPREDGYVLEEIAECLYALGRTDEARPYFAKAYARHEHDPWFPPTDPARLERIRKLGGIA